MGFFKIRKGNKAASSLREKTLDKKITKSLSHEVLMLKKADSDQMSFTAIDDGTNDNQCSSSKQSSWSLAESEIEPQRYLKFGECRRCAIVSSNSETETASPEYVSAWPPRGPEHVHIMGFAAAAYEAARFDYNNSSD